MKEYRKVIEFYYKKKCYNMYIDSENKRLFLRKDDNGNLSYITIEELIELSTHLINIPLAMNARKDNNKIKALPKVIIGGVSVTLSLTILANVIAISQSNERLKKYEKKYSNPNYTTEQQLENTISISNELNDKKDLIVDTYKQSDVLNYIFVYDMDYIDLVFENSKISVNDLKEVITNNPKISQKYKNILFDYCNQIEKKYPNIELRNFYENLKTLEVVECTKQELVNASLSVDSYGCYIRTENKIYVLKDNDYSKKTWEYQVIFHEISHCLRSGYWNKDGKKIRIQVEGENFSNVITAEALNSLFAVSLFDYDENDIAYQLQSNYHKIMIESMNNYSLDDYANHSLSYYAKKLDEFNNDENYATVILELIQFQYDDFHSKSITAKQESYYPIYDYISDMYYKKYINSNMTFEEAKEVTDSLVDKILYDVPEEYNIDTNHFYDYLKTYCKNIGIEVSTKSR